MKVGPASSYSVVDWGVEDRWVGHIEGTREYTRRAVQAPEAWQKLGVLDPHEGMLAVQLETLRLVSEGLGEEVPFIPTIFSPLAQAKHLAGNEALLWHLRQHPQAVADGLEAITESTVRFIEAAREVGISGIFYATQHARYPLLSEQEYRQFGRAYDLRVLAAAEDLWLNMIHIHGDQVMFDLLADYPAQLVNWHDRETGISLEEGLTKIPGAASGGVDHWTIHQDGPEQTLAEAKDALRQTEGRRLVLGTGCVIMTTTPLRNVRALREFVESTG